MKHKLHINDENTKINEYMLISNGDIDVANDIYLQQRCKPFRNAQGLISRIHSISLLSITNNNIELIFDKTYYQDRIHSVYNALLQVSWVKDMKIELHLILMIARDNIGILKHCMKVDCDNVIVISDRHLHYNHQNDYRIEHFIFSEYTHSTEDQRQYYYQTSKASRQSLFCHDCLIDLEHCHQCKTGVYWRNDLYSYTMCRRSHWVSTELYYGVDIHIIPLHGIFVMHAGHVNLIQLIRHLMIKVILFQIYNITKLIIFFI